MTPTRLAEILALLRMTRRGLADLTGYTHGATDQWIAGRAQVPPPVAEWLERRADEWQRDPPPSRPTPCQT